MKHIGFKHQGESKLNSDNVSYTGYNTNQAGYILVYLLHLQYRIGCSLSCSFLWIFSIVIACIYLPVHYNLLVQWKIEI